VLLLRRDPRYVAVFSGFLPVVLAMWYVNASVFDW